MLRSGDGRAFDVVSAKLEHMDGQVETKKLADGKWQVKLTVQPATLRSDASLVIKTSLASQDAIMIPLFRSAKKDEV